VPVSVVTVDDQAVFRAVARDVIDATPGFELVGEASSGEAAVSVVDEAARRITDAKPGVVVVLISIEEPAMVPSSAAECGAAALARKQDFGPAMLRDLWERHGR
jgi:DNA-binding NarL/FixJ family response regulator